MRKDFKYLPSIVLNGTQYYDYQSLMMLLRLSLHIHGYRRRQAKYPAHILELDGRAYVASPLAHVWAINIELEQRRKEVSHA